jgi:hypothetical protein
VTTAGAVVIVLSQVTLLPSRETSTANNEQLDTRYFKGLDGEYEFVLKFRVQKEGEEEYIVRSNSSYIINHNRSVSAEVNLDPGRYHVLVKVTAYRKDDVESAEEVVSRLAPVKREKLVQIGLSYDLAHAKGLVLETEQEKQAREEREQRRRKLERRKLREETKRRLQKEWIRERKMAARKERAAERRVAMSNGSLNQKQLDKRATEQIFPDGPVQSPADLAGAPTNGFDTKPVSNGSIPTINLPEDHRSTHVRQRSRETLRSSLDTAVSTSHSVYYSEQELLEGFEFDSDLDMPLEREETKAAPAPSTCCPGPGASIDPWNAVCVVGLRVYSKDQQLSLAVVRPVPEDDVVAALDMDDPAASATLEKGKFSRMLNNY